MFNNFASRGASDMQKLAICWGRNELRDYRITRRFLCFAGRWERSGRNEGKGKKVKKSQNSVLTNSGLKSLLQVVE